MRHFCHIVTLIPYHELVGSFCTVCYEQALIVAGGNISISIKVESFHTFTLDSKYLSMFTWEERC